MEISFICEACRTDQLGEVDDNDSVECVECNHYVHVGVYLGPEWEEELALLRQEDRTDAEIKTIVHGDWRQP